MQNLGRLSLMRWPELWSNEGQLWQQKLQAIYCQLRWILNKLPLFSTWPILDRQTNMTLLKGNAEERKKEPMKCEICESEDSSNKIRRMSPDKWHFDVKVLLLNFQYCGSYPEGKTHEYYLSARMFCVISQLKINIFHGKCLYSNIDIYIA